MWPEHVRACERSGEHPLIAKSIVNSDCYPCHIAKAFRERMKKKYPNFRLVYVPPKCTACAQFADVVLNKPHKNYVSRQHTLHMMQQVSQQLADGVALKDVQFDQLATATAGPALE